MDYRRIAQEYLDAPHVPHHPAYKAFVEETLQQYRSLVEGGLRFKLVPGTLTGTSEDLFRDVERGVVTVATEGSVMAPDNPMGLWIPDLGVTVNTAFRAVHDVLGHYATRTPFETFEGELAAYENHRTRYSPAARPALKGETVGQLCHFYAGYGFVRVQACKLLED